MLHSASHAKRDGMARPQAQQHCAAETAQLVDTLLKLQQRVRQRRTALPVTLVGMVLRAALRHSVKGTVQLAGMPRRPLLQVLRQLTASHVTQDGTVQLEAQRAIFCARFHSSHGHAIMFLRPCTAISC